MCSSPRLVFWICDILCMYDNKEDISVLWLCHSPPWTTVLSTLHPSIPLTSLPSMDHCLVHPPSLHPPHITPLLGPLSCPPSIPPSPSHHSPPWTTVLSTLHPSIPLTSLPSMDHCLVHPPSLHPPHITPLRGPLSCPPSIPPSPSHHSPRWTTVLSTLHPSIPLTSLPSVDHCLVHPPSLHPPHITPLHAPLSCPPSIPPSPSHHSPPCTTVLFTLHPSIPLTSLPSVDYCLVHPPSLHPPHITPLHAPLSCPPSIPPSPSHHSPRWTTVLSTLHPSLLLTSECRGGHFEDEWLLSTREAHQGQLGHQEGEVSECGGDLWAEQPTQFHRLHWESVTHGVRSVGGRG